MIVTFWGTRGSIATAGPDTVMYGGNTSCVSVLGQDPRHLVVLDAGSGVRRLGSSISADVERIDLLLTHLHLDHIVGLGFFAPLFRDDVAVTIWAPASTTSLQERLGRYLSPPLFPVRLRDVACELSLRDAGPEPVLSGEFVLSAASIIHPDTAVGYRVEADGHALAYLPDHEPALSPDFPARPDWTSGHDLARGVDLLIHDAQYSAAEYAEHVGWGHSSVVDAVAFADLAEARTLALFHHDPAHDDDAIEDLARTAAAASRGTEVFAAREGASIALGG